MTLNVIFESFSTARLAVVIAPLFIFHLLRVPRFRFRREAALYVAFFLYMVLTLLWTDNTRLALNTLLPAVSFIFILLLFGALVAYHDLLAVLAGTTFGVLLGALLYNRLSGFPFVHPANFSYNAFAGMYLLGLFTTLLWACFLRARLALLGLSMTFYALVVATTSIKFNLGIVLGVLAAAAMHFRQFAATLRRHMVPLIAVLGIVGYAAASNERVVAIFESGFDRVLLGVQVLQARENVPGYGAYENRERWRADGIRGWAENPMFGHGVEAFRDRYGITSHSTPIDVLYNSGLIGFALFYAIMFSVLWRSWRPARGQSGAVRALIFGFATCYLFVSLSAPLHYSAFFAVFVALSTGVLDRLAVEQRGDDPSGQGPG